MNTAKMTLTATVFAAVFGLALSFGAAPALADPPDPDTRCHGPLLDPHKPCEGVAENRAQTFEVALIEGDVMELGPPVETDGCLGSSKRKKAADARFPPLGDTECDGLTITTVDGVAGFDLHLCQINLNHVGQPNMGMVAFFAEGQGEVGGVLCAEPVYQGEFDARFSTADLDCRDEPADATCVTFPTLDDSDDFFLVKTSQPGKGTVVGQGQFSFGTIKWIRCGGAVVGTVC